MSSAWRRVDLMPMAYKLPSISCCYAIYISGRLVYIGSTSNMRNRFNEHAFRHGYWNEIITPWGDVPAGTNITLKYRPSRRYGDWLMVEARLIRRLKPMNNKKLKGRAA